MGESARPQERRCAIYTRKSSEEGLQQDFNSLHAQREACEAYIKSQRHEGWGLLSAKYDDGGYSGGSMERPALQRLLADITAKRIDVVVVYKVDRLTRSLADFAKIVDVFDNNGVSFVSITQAFNTTTSMGRLTLNVLLSFAQFEREVTGERIRDKIAASKKKGLWMGGFVPLGYRARDRTLVIDDADAATVRLIYDRYLMLGTVAELEHELAERKLRTRAFVSVNSNTSWGDRPFSRGHLYRILSNPIYVGKIVHNGKQYDGRHEAIIDLKTFSAVQARLASNNRQHKTRSRAKEPSLLAGLLVDAQGAKFVASHAVKDGKRYRYYVGSRVEQGEPKPWRLPAHAVEAAVISELRRLLGDQQCVAMALASLRLKTNEMKEALWTAQQLQAQITTPAPHHETIAKLIKQIRVSESELTLEINLAAIVPGRATPRNKAYQVRVPIELTRRNGETALVIVADKRDHQAEPDSALIKAIARGFTWFEELATGRSATVTAIAARERVSDRYVSQMIELAFLSPRIIEATLTGTRVAQISTKNLVFDIEIPSAWSEQENAFYARNRFGYLWSVGNGDSPSSFKNVLCFAVDS